MMKFGSRTLILTLLTSPLLLAQGASDGTRWQSTMTMQMAGMTMPAQSSYVCNDGSSDAPPIKAQKDCELYDVQRTGNTQSFKMRCTGQNAMEGSGQITYTSDSYQGSMVFHARQGDMNMTLSGKKLGRCDGTEVNGKAAVAQREQIKSQANAVLAQQNSAMAQVCAQQAEAGTSPYPFMAGTPGYLCKDPGQKASYCAHFQTHKAFAKLAADEAGFRQANVNTGQSAPLTDSAALCGVQLTAVHDKLCASAEGQGEMDFLRAQCPEQVAAVVKRECAGRSYTSVSDKYRGFCSQAAVDTASTQDGSASRSDSAADKTSKGAKKLKGLLGF